jgi:hypothetical protein
MKMSFFAMLLAQTWFARTVFKAMDTLLLRNQDSLDVPSHQGRPLIAQSSGRFKMVYIDEAMDSKAYGAIYHFETTQ